MATQFLDYKIPISLIKKTNKYLMYHLSARMWFREILKWLNVPFYDCSCPTDGGDSQPVRFNSDTDVLERHNGTEFVPIGASGVSGYAGYTGTLSIPSVGDLQFINGIAIVFTPTP